MVDFFHSIFFLLCLQSYLLCCPVAEATTVDECTQGIYVTNTSFKAVGLHPSCRLLEPNMQPASISPHSNTTTHGMHPTHKCSNMVLRMVRVTGFPEKRLIRLAMTRRGSRILFYSPTKDRVVPDQREFHHYTDHIQIGFVIQDFFTINGFLFISAIVDRSHLRIVPVDLFMRGRTLKTTISKRNYVLPVESCPPKLHKMEALEYNGSEYLAIRYDLYSDTQKAVLLRLDQIFTNSLRVVPLIPDRPLKYSGFFDDFNKEKYKKCVSEFGDFIAVPSKNQSKVYFDLRRISSNNMPSKREEYPFTIMYENQPYSADTHTGGIMLTLLGILLCGILSISVVCSINRYRTKQRRKETERNSSSTVAF